MIIPTDVQAVIALVRVVGTEFAAVPDETVAQYVLMGREYLHDPENYKSWNLAQANMACHLMWLDGLGTTSTGGGGSNQDTAGPIKKYKAGPVEIEYSDAQLSGSSSDSSESDEDEWLNKTSYGVKILLLDIGGLGGITRYG